MALEFDGFDAWRAIAENPETFVSLRAEASKTARAALAKHIKAKATGLPELRSVRKALGKQAFALLLDGLKDAEVKTLAARLDRHHPELKGADAGWRRQHIVALVKGDAEPTVKAAAVKKAKGKSGKTKSVEQDWFVSAGAVRKR